jgi:PilZ domain
MSAVLPDVLVQRVANPFFQQEDRRAAERHFCSLEATSRPLDSDLPLSWGAVVTDIAPGGLSVTICYPFRAGTFLSIDLKTPDGMVRTLMVRVVHVQDRNDGMWRLGCEFLNPLREKEIELIV